MNGTAESLLNRDEEVYGWCKKLIRLHQTNNIAFSFATEAQRHAAPPQRYSKGNQSLLRCFFNGTDLDGVAFHAAVNLDFLSTEGLGLFLGFAVQLHHFAVAD
jgi:hypothetical protein